MYEIIKTYRVLLAFVLLITFGFLTMSWLTSITPHANRDSCSIYQTYFDNFEQKDQQFFKRNSQEFDLFAMNEYYSVAPQTFSQDTGETETISSPSGDEPYDRSIYQNFKFDSKNLHAQLQESESARLTECFDTNKPHPRFTNLSLKLLEVKEFGPQPKRDADGFLPAFTKNFVTINVVSPVGYSNDGKFGMIYSEVYCGGLCGAGEYVLFERIEGEWIQVGFSMTWIS